MGTLPTISDTIRTTFDWVNTNIGRDAHNVLHFHSTAYNVPALHAALVAHVTAGMWDWVSDSSTITTISFLPLDGSSGTTVVDAPTTAAWTGASGTSDCLPQGAGVVKFSTGLKGSSHRGRIFIPHVAEGEQTNGALNDTAAVSTAWEAFRAAMNTAGFQLLVASYTHSSTQDVQAVSADARLRTQRRREP